MAWTGNILRDGRSHGAESSSFRGVLNQRLIAGKEWSGFVGRKQNLLPLHSHNTHRCQADHVEAKGIGAAGNPGYQGQRARACLLIHSQITHSTSPGQEIPSWCSSRGMCKHSFSTRQRGKGQPDLQALCQGTSSWLRRGSRCHTCPHSCSFPGCGCCLHEQGGTGGQGGRPERRTQLPSSPL